MKNVKKVIFHVVLTIVILYGSYFVFMEYQLNVFEKQVKSYLVDRKSYKEGDIASISGVRSKGGDYGVTVIVEFSDEPGVKYYYKRIQGSIQQDKRVFPESEKRKHLGESDVSHYKTLCVCRFGLEEHMHFERSTP